MQELKAGVTDAAVEKHVPVYTIEGSHVHVVVGETKHPMLEEHFIEWITLNTNQGIYRKQLNPGQEPVADFCPFPFVELKNLLKIGVPSAGENMSYSFFLQAALWHL